MTSPYVRKKEHSVLNNRLPNNTQITTNNISGLLCRSRPLRFIEDQLNLKNRIVKNTSQNTSRKINGVLDTHLHETLWTLGGQKKPLQKTRERREKNRGNLGRNRAQRTPRPSYEAGKIIIHHKYIDKFIERRSNFNRVKRYFLNQSTDLNKS